jgi:type VI secretion system protein ImpF
MPRPDSDDLLLPSMLDRLIDPDTGGALNRRGYGLNQMIDAVRRDLENLLNTRLTNTVPSDKYPEVQRSIAAYGIPDFGSVNAFTSVQRDAIGRIIERVITTFEPRLRDVHATLVERSDARDRTVRFHIDARLALDPAPEVSFETVLELMTGRASIRPSEA